jgi:predicted HAD superfamily phosphohydrolase
MTFEPSLPRSGFAVGAIVLALALPACAPAAGVDEERLEEVVADLEARFTPGLHSLMAELGERHATLWFAGEAGNWALADYYLHELEELIEDIEELHPTYREVPVAELLGEMTHPAVERLEDAVSGEDREGFVRAYDELVRACNACHVASGLGAMVIQRPTTPPLTNIRFRP